MGLNEMNFKNEKYNDKKEVDLYSLDPFESSDSDKASSSSSNDLDILVELEDDAKMKWIIKRKLMNNKKNIIGYDKLLEVWSKRPFDSDDEKNLNNLKFKWRWKRSVELKAVNHPERKEEYIVFGLLPKLEISFHRNKLVEDDSSYHESLV